MRKLLIIVALNLIVLCQMSLYADTLAIEKETKCGINFQVDPRIELLAVIQYLSESSMVCQESSEYSLAIDEWFAEYKNHPIIPLWQKLENRGFSYDAPIVYFLQFGSLPFHVKQNSFPDYYHIFSERMLKILRTQAEEKEFIDQLNDFVEESKFSDFFLEQSEFYQAQVKASLAVLPEKDITGTIISWFGYSQDSFNFIVSPLLGGNGYGPCVKNARGGLDLYCITSACRDERSLMEMLLHEYSHSYINPLVEEYYGSLNKTKKLYKPIAKSMENQAYCSWWVTLAEHYVRASVIRLQLSLSDETNVNSLIREQTSRGFIYVPYINEDLQRYEHQRITSGTSFRDYFPYLVKRMTVLSKSPGAYIEKETQFKGNITSAYASNMLIIVPETDADSTVTKYILPNAEFVAGRIGGTIITDTKALKMNLSKYSLVIYGCPQQNTWLAKHIDKMRFHILPDRIIANQEYIGSDLRIISAEPNPYNPKLGMVVYTAQRPEDMKSSNSVFHGPQEFVISDHLGVVLGEGFYDGE